MKACTDLPQSKKLAEILPIESADMHYSSWTILEDGEYILSPNNGETIKSMQEDYGNQVIPAWSLSALLEVIRNHDRHELYLYEGGYYFECGEFMTESYFNPIDAAFEMVVWLKENKHI